MGIGASLVYWAKSNTFTLLMGFTMPLPFSRKSHCLMINWIHLLSTYIFLPRHILPHTPCHSSMLTLTGSFATILTGICHLIIQWFSLSLGYVLQSLNNYFYLLSMIGMMSNTFMADVPIVLRINNHFSNHLSHHHIFTSDFFPKYPPSV